MPGCAIPVIEVRRVYECSARQAGEYRVLVDRLWPRGVSKASLPIDRWEKDVAPSTELRRWYGHDPDRFDEFSTRYRSELRKSPAAEALEAILDSAGRHRALILLTATKQVERSGAAVLVDHLRRRRR
jgi:uncharacterized protein YeaO (DUF488 family)